MFVKSRFYSVKCLKWIGTDNGVHKCIFLNVFEFFIICEWFLKNGGTKRTTFEFFVTSSVLNAQPTISSVLKTSVYIMQSYLIEFNFWRIIFCIIWGHMSDIVWLAKESSQTREDKLQGVSEIVFLWVITYDNFFEVFACVFCSKRVF